MFCLDLLGNVTQLALMKAQWERLRGQAKMVTDSKPCYRVRLDHGRKGSMIEVSFSGPKRIANRFSVNIGTGVDEASQHVTDDRMVAVIPKGVVAFMGIKWVTKKGSQRAAINLIGRKECVLAEVLLPRDARAEIEGGTFQNPAILTASTIVKLASHFVTDEVAIERAEKLGYRFFPADMMLVPKVSVAPQTAPIAVPPRVQKKAAYNGRVKKKKKAMAKAK